MGVACVRVGGWGVNGAHPVRVRAMQPRDNWQLLAYDPLYLTMQLSDGRPAGSMYPACSIGKKSSIQSLADWATASTARQSGSCISVKGHTAAACAVSIEARRDYAITRVKATPACSLILAATAAMVYQGVDGCGRCTALATCTAR